MGTELINNIKHASGKKKLPLIKLNFCFKSSKAKKDHQKAKPGKKRVERKDLALEDTFSIFFYYPLPLPWFTLISPQRHFSLSDSGYVSWNCRNRIKSYSVYECYVQ